MAKLISTDNFWIVDTDPDNKLISIPRFDYIGAKKKKIRRHWGIDSAGKKWSKEVFYPKKDYSKQQMEDTIIPKYSNCPNCLTNNTTEDDIIPLEIVPKKIKYNKKILVSGITIIAVSIGSMFLVNWLRTRNKE